MGGARGAVREAIIPPYLGGLDPRRALPAPGSDVTAGGSELGFTRARGQDDVSKHKANPIKLIN